MCVKAALFGLFFDGLHDHMHLCAMTAGIQLRPGKFVSSLVYADDVVLLSWTTSGLQLFLDSIDRFCLCFSLVISPSMTEVVVFNGLGDASILAGWQSSPFTVLLQVQVPWPDLPRVWQHVVCTPADGPEHCGCLCPAAGTTQRAFVSCSSEA